MRGVRGGRGSELLGLACAEFAVGGADAAALLLGAAVALECSSALGVGASCEFVEHAGSCECEPIRILSRPVEN